MQSFFRSAIPMKKISFDECKGRRLFDMDCERLRRIDGMIAILHGPSLDDGVCMEIGFAVARGVPVVILTTDFQSLRPPCGWTHFRLLRASAGNSG